MVRKEGPTKSRVFALIALFCGLLVMASVAEFLGIPDEEIVPVKMSEHSTMLEVKPAKGG